MSYYDFYKGLNGSEAYGVKDMNGYLIGKNIRELPTFAPIDTPSTPVVSYRGSLEPALTPAQELRIARERKVNYAKARRLMSEDRLDKINAHCEMVYTMAQDGKLTQLLQSSPKFHQKMIKFLNQCHILYSNDHNQEKPKLDNNEPVTNTVKRIISAIERKQLQGVLHHNHDRHLNALKNLSQEMNDRIAGKSAAFIFIKQNLKKLVFTGASIGGVLLAYNLISTAPNTDNGIYQTSAGRAHFITGNDIKAHTGPGREYDVMGSFNKGTCVMIEQTQNGWGVVGTKQGVKHYIDGRYLETRTFSPRC